MPQNMTVRELAQMQGRLDIFDAEYMAVTPLPEEIWKTHPYFEGHVQISNKGRIRRVPRLGPDGKPTPRGVKKPRILRPTSKSPGSPLYAKIRIQEREYVKLLAAAVLELFGPPKPSSSHIATFNNGDPYNVDVENLAWLTPTEFYERRIRPALAKKRENIAQQREDETAAAEERSERGERSERIAQKTEEPLAAIDVPQRKRSSDEEIAARKARNVEAYMSTGESSSLTVGSSLPRVTEAECVSARNLILTQYRDGKMDASEAAMLIAALGLRPEDQEMYREVDLQRKK